MVNRMNQKTLEKMSFKELMTELGSVMDKAMKLQQRALELKNEIDKRKNKMVNRNAKL